MTQWNYNDIIHHPRHQVTERPPMSHWDRAAQFAPFSALSGHSEGTREVARTTQPRMELWEDAVALLEDNLRLIESRIEEEPEVSITYFVPDQRKAGGAYITEVGKVKKMNTFERLLVLVDGRSISMDEMIEIKMLDVEK